MTRWFFELPLLNQVILIYFVAINIVTFFYFGIDKIKAQVGSRRISEKRLWLLSLLGGSLGALVGINFFRHKTRKVSFQTGFFVIFLLQVTIIFLLMQ